MLLGFFLSRAPPKPRAPRRPTARRSRVRQREVGPASETRRQSAIRRRGADRRRECTNESEKPIFTPPFSLQAIVAGDSPEDALVHMRRARTEFAASARKYLQIYASCCKTLVGVSAITAHSATTKLEINFDGLDIFDFLPQ